ncbi:hypothetical protein HID58_063054 [Brassica napus]|uniref:RNase H type-1 domain-containing protein n=1 Tax=Brassica napus TaxID=3708 RepID=A0ABQ8A3Z9_BRANA|nr:hypothetical protein HID58_063054 [Brassica napus]
MVFTDIFTGKDPIASKTASFPSTMISQKIIVEFSLIHGKFASTTVDLLPQVIILHPCAAVAKSQLSTSMADMLHRAIGSILVLAKTKGRPDLLDGPPGFPPLFPELSKQDQKMAMLYISHADDTERQARILRVKQGIAENEMESSLRITKITNQLDKGKGHVFQYSDMMKPTQGESSLPLIPVSIANKDLSKADSSGSSSYGSESLSAPIDGSTGFQLGPSSGGRVSGNHLKSKSQRKRPSSWKRKLSPRPCTSLAAPELVKQSWGEELSDSSNTMERIARCRQNILKWKKNSDTNSRTSMLSTTWQKPPVGFVKCNVGSSWDVSSLKCGAAWIVRDHQGLPLFHSRRAFSSVFSSFEADLFSIMWSLEALRDLHITKVILEVSSAEAWQALISPEKFPNVSDALSRLRRIANDFEHFQVVRSLPGINSVALSIARSVTKDRRYQSYLARGGPSWLASYLHSEALGGAAAS